MKAMSELFNEDYLVKSPEFASAINDTVLPELEKCREDHTIPGNKQCPLFCSVFRADQPCGTVLVLHGFTENTYKYSELIYSLIRNHFSVVAYDQRGHGRSGRTEGLDNPSVTHVDRFEDYVEDLGIVCRTLLSGLPKPWKILSHSMGGAVSSLYLEKHPETFSAAALCSPMIAPNTSFPSAAAFVMARMNCLFRKDKKAPFFMKPYAGPEDFATSCATDPSRFAWYDAVKAAHTEYQNSIPSWRWIAESIAVTRKILAPGAPESIACPVLLSSADKDYSVMHEPQQQFIDRVPNGKYIFVKDSRHEIFRSVNSVFFPWWHTILSFLKEADV